MGDFYGYFGHLADAALSSAGHYFQTGKKVHVTKTKAPSIRRCLCAMLNSVDLEDAGHGVGDLGGIGVDGVVDDRKGFGFVQLIIPVDT